MIVYDNLFTMADLVEAFWYSTGQSGAAEVKTHIFATNRYIKGRRLVIRKLYNFLRLACLLLQQSDSSAHVSNKKLRKQINE